MGAFTGCDPGTALGPVEEVEIRGAVPSITAGDTLRLSATPKDASGNSLSGRTVTWSSSDPAVASVSPEGVVRGEGPGTATITATAGQRSGSVAMKVAVQRMVSAGGSHTCALTPGGAAFCWGSNGAGQLGSAAASESCRGEPCSTRPLPVSGGLTFVSVSAGSGYTCGLTPGGAAYCWGDNRHGELGNGSTTSSSVPVPVSGGLAFASLRAGQDHTCGVTRTGQAYCWGINRFGELGSRPTTSTDTCANVWGDPVPCSTRPTAVSGGLTFASVHPGNIYTCGLTPAGAAYCWGKNEAGLLGTTAVTESCGGVDRDFTCSATPVTVSGGLTFASLSVGGSHTCGVARDAQAYCWGLNSWGKLGRSLDGSISTPTPGAVSGGLSFTAVSAGNLHSCAIATGGAAHCWGFGFGGALGNGSRAGGGPTPVAVVGGLTFASLSAGGSHSCGVTPQGATYCWGLNSGGQLGSTAAAETCVVDRGGSQHPCSSTPLPVRLESAASAFSGAKDTHRLRGATGREVT